MALTKSFKTTVMLRAAKDPVFCKAMLSDALTALLTGEVDVGKAILRDYINATISFDALSKAMRQDPKSLMRMLSARGNPTSRSLFSMLQVIQEMKKIRFKVSVQ